MGRDHLDAVLSSYAGTTIAAASIMGRMRRSLPTLKRRLGYGFATVTSVLTELAMKQFS
jgi:hypothetical protein